MTKRGTRLFFILCTWGSALGVRRPRDDSHRRFPTLTHSAAVDASVIAGKIVWHRAGGQRRRPIAGGGVERPRCRCSRYRLERRSAQGGIRDDMGCRPAGWPDDVRSSGSLRHPSEGRRCPFAFTGSTSRARGRDRWRLTAAWNTMFAYCGERLVQGVEDVIGANDVGQAVAVQIGLQGRLHVDEYQPDARAGQVVVKLLQHSCCRVIHVRNGAGIHHQPGDRRRRSLDQAAHVRREAADVGIEEIRPESEDHQAGPA
jgi:hypothetical protein